jgi:hypothetical protein
MPTTIYRLSVVFGTQEGLSPVGRTKGHEDFLLRDPADPLIPGTDIARMLVTPLGVKAVGVASTEVERVQEGLQRLAKTRLSDRARERDRKPRRRVTEESATTA